MFIVACSTIIAACNQLHQYTPLLNDCRWKNTVFYVNLYDLYMYRESWKAVDEFTISCIWWFEAERKYIYAIAVPLVRIRTIQHTTRDMTTFEFFLAVTFAASAGKTLFTLLFLPSCSCAWKILSPFNPCVCIVGANSCYLCTDGEYIVDEKRSPKLNALFQVLKNNDNKGCAENEGSDVLECDGDTICMLLRASFTISIIDEGKELSTCTWM